MKVSLLQRADKWLGIPICFALTVLSAVFHRRAAAPFAAPRNVPFVKLAEQGSRVLAYPALLRIVEMVGRGNAYFIAFEDNRFILDALGVIPRVNVATLSIESVRQFLWSMLRVVKRVRRLKVDTAIDMEFFSRGSAALAYLSGARRRVGFHAFHAGGPWRGNLMTHRLIYNPHLHTSLTFLGLVDAVLLDPVELPTLGAPDAAFEGNAQKPQVLQRSQEGNQTDYCYEDKEEKALGRGGSRWLTNGRNLPEPPRLVPRSDELAEIRGMLGGGMEGAWPVVVLNPNCGDFLPLRRWPAERYVELGRRLIARFPDVLLVLTGSAREAEATSGLVRAVASERCISVAGKTALKQLLVLYTLGDVLVTNDSGPPHFAALTPIRMVALFGPETPELFAAQTPRSRILWTGLPSSPCVSAYNNRQSPCRNNACMQAIVVEAVFGAVCRAVEERRGEQKRVPDA
jgi:ADP-heptose:LPS heptosyltransferase